MFIKKLGLNLLTVEVQVVIRFGRNMYFLERHDRMLRIHLYDKHIEIPDEFRHHKNLVQLEWIHFGRPNDFYLLQVSLTSPAVFLPNVFFFFEGKTKKMQRLICTSICCWLLHQCYIYVQETFLYTSFMVFFHEINCMLYVVCNGCLA